MSEAVETKPKRTPKPLPEGVPTRQDFKRIQKAILVCVALSEAEFDFVSKHVAELRARS